MTERNAQNPPEELGATTAYLLEEVRKMNIPYLRFRDSSLILLGYGSRQRKLRTAVVGSTSAIGMEIAGDKEETKQLLADALIPTPRGFLVYDEAELRRAFDRTRLPVVTKPLDGNHGRGVTTHIDTFEKALAGFRTAKKISGAVIVEEFLEGDDHRFLVIDFKLVAVAKRTPAMVTGNGFSTIAALIDEENLNPQRGHGPEHVLAPIETDEVTLRMLSEKDLSPGSVPASGETVFLKDTANISAGGTSTDVTDCVHPDNVFLAERVARLFDLDICGIDIVTTDVSVPLTESKGGIIEVNAGPGLRMHTNPTVGRPRNVAAPILEMLFPEGISRIPIVGTNRTNDDNLTVRLLTKLAEQKGYRVGRTESSGAYVTDRKVSDIDGTTPECGRIVLFDPLVDFAVLTCGHGAEPASRFAFDACNIGIIHTLDHPQYETAISLIHKIPPAGYAILDADDHRTFSMVHEMPCRYAFIGTEKEDEFLLRQGHGERTALLFKNGAATLYSKDIQTVLFSLGDIRFTPDRVQLKALLSTALAAFILGFGLETIREVFRNHKI